MRPNNGFGASHYGIKTFFGDVYCIFVTFPCGILGKVWYLIVSFPDLCGLSYFQSLFVTFQYRGLHHSALYCTLIIEAWLNSNFHFDCTYLKL